jgi:uncharacterized protein YdaT
MLEFALGDQGYMVGVSLPVEISKKEKWYTKNSTANGKQ